jgi:hypothetical protein
VGGVKGLPCFAFFPDWVIFCLFQQISRWVQGAAEGQISNPYKAFEVKSDLDGLLYNSIPKSCCFIQDGDATEVDAVSCFKPMFCRSGFFHLAQADASHILFATSFCGPATLSHIDHAHSQGTPYICTTFRPNLFFKGITILVVFFTGLCMVLGINNADSWKCKGDDSEKNQTLSILPYYWTAVVTLFELSR